MLDSPTYLGLMNVCVGCCGKYCGLGYFASFISFLGALIGPPAELYIPFVEFVSLICAYLLVFLH
jgi:hypothetical protein